MSKAKKSTGRPLKYNWLAEYIEEDVLYSPAGLVDAALEKGHSMLVTLPETELKILRAKIRRTLWRLIKARGFMPDGKVKCVGQQPHMAYAGRKWIKALKPQGCT